MGERQAIKDQVREQLKERGSGRAGAGGIEG